MLDGVIWLERTTNRADLALLSKLIDGEPDYVRWKVDLNDGEGYASSYDQAEDDTLYIKMDDDIVSSRCTIHSRGLLFGYRMRWQVSMIPDLG
jgi:hypothetical protein